MVEPRPLRHYNPVGAQVPNGPPVEGDGAVRDRREPGGELEQRLPAGAVPAYSGSTDRSPAPPVPADPS